MYTLDANSKYRFSYDEVRSVLDEDMMRKMLLLTNYVRVQRSGIDTIKYHT